MRPVALALAAALAGCGGRSQQKSPVVPGIEAGDWPEYRRDPSGSSAAGPAVPAADAGALSGRWTANLGSGTYAQPVVAAGVVYLTTTPDASVVALDLATGAVRWRHDFDAATEATCQRAPQHPGTWGSAAVLDGRVYAASPDGGVYALDAATGATVWRAAVASPAPHGELVEDSVVVSRALGRAYVGVASTVHCDQIAGRIAAVELSTGAVTSRTLVPDGARGGAVWASLAVDEAAGRVYAATGNAIGDRTREPYAQAVIALDARTLEPLDAWQNPTPLENADFGAAPTLFAAGGRSLVAAASKDGFLYVLDRASLARGPVWTFRLAVTAGDGQGGDPLAGLGSIVPASFANGLLYAGGGRTADGDPGALFALDPATGAVAWKHATPGPVLQPAAVGTEIVAVVSAFRPDTREGAVLELLDARSGALLASFADPATPSLSAPSLPAGRVIWATADGSVRALGR